MATAEGWLYLATVEDLHSRRIVGWSMSVRIDSRLVVDVLEMALAGRQPGAGLVAHSDRGSQYDSEHDQRLLACHGIACSMSRRANCWDKEPMESFFANLTKDTATTSSLCTCCRGRSGNLGDSLPMGLALAGALVFRGVSLPSARPGAGVC